MTDIVEFVNLFYGSETYKFIKTHTLQGKWFAYKPKVGNLTPSCGLPMSAFCANPYTGGYPTGYGRNIDSSNSVPIKFLPKIMLKGFTHFSQSGTGFIEIFYNYFLIAPSAFRHTALEETALPGYYHVRTAAYTASVVAGGSYVVYRFENCKKKIIKFFPGYSGLEYPLGLRHKNCPFKIKEDNGIVKVTADYGTVVIHYAMKKPQGTALYTIRNGYALEFGGNSTEFALAYSFVSQDDAVSALEKADSFEDCKSKAQAIWNNILSKVEYVGNNPKMFYTAMYHSLKKPCIDEGFTCTAFDFATLWDMYKTQLPMIFLLCPEESKRIVKGLDGMYLGERYTNARLMETNLRPFCENQAKCLVTILLATAKLYGIEGITEEMCKHMISDVKTSAKDKSIMPVIAHNFDVADGVCALQNAGVTSTEADNIEERMKKQLDEFGVLIVDKKDAKFYEGNNWTYSFRVGAATERRLKFTDKKKLKEALDAYFGFGMEDAKDFITPQKFTPQRVEKCGDALKRFAGMNNEPDIDVPFMYHMLGEYERCNDVVDACRGKYRPTKDGLCGNDDSGGLSSWYVWAAMGLYPIVGSSEFLIFKGEAQKVTLHLGNDFTIVNSGLEVPTLNGKPLANRRITIADIKNGGELVI